VPSLAHRPDGVFRVARTAPIGPTHAVCAVTGATVCGVEEETLAEVLNEDWEAACFVEKCADCFAAVLADSGGSSHIVCDQRTTGATLTDSARGSRESGLGARSFSVASLSCCRSSGCRRRSDAT
jgi:hypothetical protein